MLFGLMIVPLVHNRAVRLMTGAWRRRRRCRPIRPRDQLRAEFAMSARRSDERPVARGKTTSQLAELGKKSEPSTA
jgi:hypothetical protein